MRRIFSCVKSKLGIIRVYTYNESCKHSTYRLFHRVWPTIQVTEKTKGDPSHSILFHTQQPTESSQVCPRGPLHRQPLVFSFALHARRTGAYVGILLHRLQIKSRRHMRLLLISHRRLGECNCLIVAHPHLQDRIRPTERSNNNPAPTSRIKVGTGSLQHVPCGMNDRDIRNYFWRISFRL